MASVNKAILVGRLGADPELRYTTSGTAVADLSVATDSVWTDAKGVRQSKTEWHKVVVWKKTAEHCKEYLAKGRQVYVEGRIETEQWQDRDGNKRYTTKIQAYTVVFLDSKGSTAAPRGQEQEQAPDLADDDSIPF